MYLEQHVIELRRRQASAETLLEAINDAVNARWLPNEQGRVPRMDVQMAVSQWLGRGEKYDPRLATLVAKVMKSRGIKKRCLTGRWFYGLEPRKGEPTTFDRKANR
jgi:glutamine synthetase type III